MNKFFSRFYLVLFALLLLGPGCAYFKPKKVEKKEPPRKPAHTSTKPQPKTIDVQAQQRYYDLGLKYYTEENYVEAKNAWQRVIQMGPDSPLAEKARDYLKKTEQVLKTLKEIEKR